MKRVMVVLLLSTFSFAVGAESGKSKVKVTDSQVVREWCEKKSEKYFKKRKLIPYNWTASWHDEVNMIVVEGEWQVDDRQAKVRCESERGKSLKGAKMEVTYDEISM